MTASLIACTTNDLALSLLANPCDIANALLMYFWILGKSHAISVHEYSHTCVVLYDVLIFHFESDDTRPQHLLLQSWYDHKVICLI